MDLLFLSHCVPNPPNKGERIRAARELEYLSSRYRVHLACFARNELERAFARELRKRCASAYFEPISFPKAAIPAAFRVAGGRSLSFSLYDSPNMRRYVNDLTERVPLAATFVYTAVMSQFAPAGVPRLTDLVDVDSEKWFEYSGRRRPGFLYALEAERFRREEIRQSHDRLLLTTEAEKKLFCSFAPHARVRVLTNGVDTTYFDPSESEVPSELQNRRIIVFVGTMDYYPNVEGVRWFATKMLPLLRQRDPRIEFFIVGRDPNRAVMRLARQPGVTVTGTVPDVRPYLSACHAMVAPLRIARGIQNKVLEALSMGKPVLASEAVFQTFGSTPPPGVLRCKTEQDFVETALNIPAFSDRMASSIRADVQQRFQWHQTLGVLSDELENLITEHSTSKQVVRQ
jgi:sugar transferase (PEP-CTERM/EpsH1 system associated)